MGVGSTRLAYALKNLRLRWEQATESWNDQVSQDFEEKHLVPLERQVSSTVRGIEEIAEIMAKVRRDCS